MERCPYCGYEGGVYRTYTGKQYYYWDGEPAGYNDDVYDNQKTFVRCIKCNRRISMKRILESKEVNKNDC